MNSKEILKKVRNNKEATNLYCFLLKRNETQQLSDYNDFFINLTKEVMEELDIQPINKTDSSFRFNKKGIHTLLVEIGMDIMEETGCTADDGLKEKIKELCYADLNMIPNPETIFAPVEEGQIEKALTSLKIKNIILKSLTFLEKIDNIHQQNYLKQYTKEEVIKEFEEYIIKKTNELFDAVPECETKNILTKKSFLNNILNLCSVEIEASLLWAEKEIENIRRIKISLDNSSSKEEKERLSNEITEGIYYKLLFAKEKEPPFMVRVKKQMEKHLKNCQFISQETEKKLEMIN